jgi:hypothetical protein
MLKYHGILPSMSRPGNPYDNAFCESFIKTLKREEIYANEYTHIDELGVHLEEFIDRYYNRLRLHSALGYKTPAEFEAASAPHAAPTMIFRGMGKSIDPGNGEAGPVKKAGSRFRPTPQLIASMSLQLVIP